MPIDTVDQRCKTLLGKLLSIAFLTGNSPYNCEY